MAANTSVILPQIKEAGTFAYYTIESANSLASTSQTNAFLVVPYTQVTLFLSVGTVTGTSPTLDVKVQKRLADSTTKDLASSATWHDIAAFTQVTSSNTKRVMSLISGGNKEEAQQSGALTAGTVNSVAFGGVWRINFVITGTNPVFPVSLYFEGLV